MAITRLSRVLSIWHLFRNCEEVSWKEFTDQFGKISRKTILRDLHLLHQAGVLKARYDRGRQAFVPVSTELFPMEPQENKTRQQYLEKIRRLCMLMRRMSWEDERNGMNKRDLYRELFPENSDRTRQRDFAELDKLGYRAWYEPAWFIEPGRWYYEIPTAYSLETFLWYQEKLTEREGRSEPGKDGQS